MTYSLHYTSMQFRKGRGKTMRIFIPTTFLDNNIYLFIEAVCLLQSITFVVFQFNIHLIITLRRE